MPNSTPSPRRRRQRASIGRDPPRGKTPSLSDESEAVVTWMARKVLVATNSKRRSIPNRKSRPVGGQQDAVPRSRAPVPGGVSRAEPQQYRSSEFYDLFSQALTTCDQPSSRGPQSATFVRVPSEGDFQERTSRRSRPEANSRIEPTLIGHASRRSARTTRDADAPTSSKGVAGDSASPRRQRHARRDGTHPEGSTK